MATHAHAHRHHAGPDLTAAAKQALENDGERWTGMRAEVFEELARHTKPVSAYEIASNIGQQRGRRVAPNSIYRILDLFVQTNLANRIESANAFMANPHPGQRHDCIFLICDECGIANHYDDDALTRPLRVAGHDAGFDDLRPVIELHGRCSDCRK